MRLSAEGGVEGGVDPGQVQKRLERGGTIVGFLGWLGYGTAVRVPAGRGFVTYNCPAGTAGLFFQRSQMWDRRGRWKGK